MTKKKQNLSHQELLEQALVPEHEWHYKVPENWVWIKLGSICKLSNGDKIKGIDMHYLEVKVLRGKCDASIKNSGAFISKGSKVILVDGENSGEVFHIDMDGYMGSTFKKLEIANGANDNFVELFISMYKEEFKNSKIGSAIPHLNKDIFYNLSFPFPPAFEQKRIVDRIESLFEKLDLAKELIHDVLDSFEIRKAAILHKAFSGELTANWRMDNVVRINSILEDIKNYYMNEQNSKHIKAITEFNDCAFVLKNIENSIWFATKIGAIGAVSNGSTPSRGRIEFWNGDIPWISSGEVRNNIIETSKERITELGYENTSVKKLAPGTVLIAMIGEGKTRGQCAVIDIEATINQNIAAIDMSHKFVNPKFLWYWLQKKYKENRKEGSGTGPQALNCQRVRELDFVLPPLIEQNEIVKILDQILEKEKDAYVLYDVAEEIELMKKSIINRAFRCELGTNNPDEESAKVLIKSILAVDSTTLHSTRGKTKDNNANILTKEKANMAKTIIEVLREQKNLTPEKLKSLTGIIDIDEFYAELKILVDIGEVVEIREGDESFLEVNYADRQA